ncbi:MAG: hydantoinase/oxoprolinase family protein, partial [Verrucomicrobiota bacterium]|nr:hydantoinase/oxoprolinase family protein [Verrucomicrobiota bacterium]
MTKYVIGMDIGGTNTDAVLLDEQNKIVWAVKTTTTEDISLGFEAALTNLIEQSAVSPEQIQGVFLGTTHATNAILQKRDLFRVGVIRIAGQRPETLPVAFAWPMELKNAVIGGIETIRGGLECHGGTLTDLCKEETRKAILSLLEKEVNSIAIIGV